MQEMDPGRATSDSVKRKKKTQATAQQIGASGRGLPPTPTSLDMDIAAEHERDGAGGLERGGRRTGEKTDRKLNMLGDC